MSLICGIFEYKIFVFTGFINLQALGVFGLCQIHAFVDYVRARLSKEQFDVLFKRVVSTIAGE